MAGGGALRRVGVVGAASGGSGCLRTRVRTGERRATCAAPAIAVGAVGGSALGAAGPIATVRSVSVTGSPRAAASAARPTSPADG